MIRRIRIQGSRKNTRHSSCTVATAQEQESCAGAGNDLHRNCQHSAVPSTDPINFQRNHSRRLTQGSSTPDIMSLCAGRNRILQPVRHAIISCHETIDERHSLQSPVIGSYDRLPPLGSSGDDRPLCADSHCSIYTDNIGHTDCRATDKLNNHIRTGRGNWALHSWRQYIADHLCDPGGT